VSETGAVLLTTTGPDTDSCNEYTGTVETREQATEMGAAGVADRDTRREIEEPSTTELL